AAAQAVVDLEREGEAGGRAADAVDRVADVDRDAPDPDGVADSDTDDRAVLPVGRRHRAKRLLAGVAEGVLAGVARGEPARQQDQVVLGAPRGGVDGGDDVARMDAGLSSGARVSHRYGTTAPGARRGLLS